tara:strand:+ start:1009 stop:1179 length:171 start_codon:yes stop_codon:yes gene_type:complete
LVIVKFRIELEFVEMESQELPQGLWVSLCCDLEGYFGCYEACRLFEPPYGLARLLT